MSRRSEMTDDGKIPCGLCGEWLFIGAFYTLPIIEGVSSFVDIWYGDPETGKQYGRPKSYCRVCNQVSQKGKARLDAYRACLKTLVYDIEEAWLQAHEEAYRRNPPEDVWASLKRSVGME